MADWTGQSSSDNAKLGAACKAQFPQELDAVGLDELSDANLGAVLSALGVDMDDLNDPNFDLSSKLSGADLGNLLSNASSLFSTPTTDSGSSASSVLSPTNWVTTKTDATPAVTDYRTTAVGSSRNAKVESDPEGSYIFALEIDGIEIAHFYECSGLKSVTTVVEIEEGGMNHRVHKLPGQSRWENITLRQGVTSDLTFLQWRDLILQDKLQESSGYRKSGAILMKNNQMETIRRYNFIDAWPVSWEGPSFSSNQSEVAIEALELAHHGIQVT